MRRVLAMTLFVATCTAFAGVAAPSRQQPVAQASPAELTALATKARLDGRIVAWCRAAFRAGQSGGFAVAVTAADGGGRYAALDANGTATTLAAFTTGADLACYSRREAENLNASIKESETIHGSVRPRWNSTVICGFVRDTEASCWQYSPTERTFVQVGGWIT